MAQQPVDNSQPPKPAPAVTKPAVQGSDKIEFGKNYFQTNVVVPLGEAPPELKQAFKVAAGER
jgi:hypothetical protein